MEINLRGLKQKRARLIKECKEMLDLAITEERGLNKKEQAKYDELESEINSLKESIEKEERKIELETGYKPGQEPIRNNPIGMERSYDPKEVRVYNKDSLGEMRSFIKSQDTNGITEPVSVGKYVRALITGDWTNAQTEKRLLGTATSGGGYLVPQILSSDIIWAALNKTQCMSAGAYVVNMESKTLVVPRVLTMPAIEWKAENAAFSKSLDTTFDAVTLTSKTLMSLVSLSYELAQDGLNIESVIEEELAKGLSLELDRAALMGAGTLEPTGVKNTANILTQILDNPAVYANFSTAWAKVEAENFSPNSLIVNTSVLGDLDLQVEATTNAPMRPCESWATFRKFPSNQLADAACLGDFKQMMIGIRSQVNIEVSRQAGDAFKEAKVLIRAILRADVQLRNPKAFCWIAFVPSPSLSPSASASPSE